MSADMCNTLVVPMGTLEKLEPKMDCVLLQDLYTTSHFYHSVGLEPLCTQSSNNYGITICVLYSPKVSQ